MKDFKSYRDFKVDGAVGCMLFMPPNKMWIGTDKSIVILDTNVCRVDKRERERERERERKEGGREPWR